VEPTKVHSALESLGKSLNYASAQNRTSIEKREQQSKTKANQYAQ